MHSSRCCCHDAFPKSQPFLVFPSPLLSPAETTALLLATAVIHRGADYYQTVLQPARHQVQNIKKGQELCTFHVSATQEKISASSQQEQTLVQHHRAAPFGYLAEERRCCALLSSGEEHNTLCALKADFLPSLALIHSSVQSLCFRK